MIGDIREAPGISAKRSLSNGAGRSPPPTEGAGVDRRRGEVTPPYGSSVGGAKQRADVPRAWLPPTKFRNEIWGVSHGHRPLRPVGGRGTARRVVVPGEPPQLPWAAVHSGAFAARSRGMGEDWSRDYPQKGHQLRTIPQSRRSRDSSLYTREPWGRGMRIAASLRSSQ